MRFTVTAMARMRVRVEGGATGWEEKALPIEPELVAEAPIDAVRLLREGVAALFDPTTMYGIEGSAVELVSHYSVLPTLALMEPGAAWGMRCEIRVLLLTEDKPWARVTDQGRG